MPAPDWITTEQGDMVDVAQVLSVRVSGASIVIYLADGSNITYLYESNTAALTSLADYVAAFDPIDVAEPNIIPAMTSNNTPSGVASAISETGAGFEAYRAFDQSDGTSWANALAGPPWWLKYEFPSVTLITSYQLYIADPNTAPEDWTFEGSPDDVVWTTLDTQTGYDVAAWTANPTASFPFSNSTSYLYYRINATNSTSGLNDQIFIAELRMVGGGSSAWIVTQANDLVQTNKITSIRVVQSSLEIRFVSGPPLVYPFETNAVAREWFDMYSDVIGPTQL